MKYRKEIIRLAVPAMFENILQMLMGVVDNYLVAQIGLIAVSGVSVANNIVIIYQAIFIALGAAVSSLVAKTKEKSNQESYRRYLSESLFLTLIISVILGMLSIVFGRYFLEVLGTTPSVTQAGDIYLKTVGGLIVGMGLMTTFSAILRAQGYPNLPMYISIVANVLNAVLSSLAIFVFHFGIVGVGVSTVLSRFVGVYILGRKLPIVEMFKNIRFKVSKELLSIALPSAGERLMMRMGDVIIVSLIVGLGTKVVAGNAIGETLTQFNYMPGIAVSTATIILVAQSIGQQEEKEIKSIIKSSYIIAVVSMLIIALLLLLNAYTLSSTFTRDTTALASSKLVLYYSLLCGPFSAGTLVYTALWQGIGKAKIPFYATTVGMWGIRVCVGYLLTVQCGLGLSGVWIATILDNLFRFMTLKIILKKTSK